MSKTIIVLLVLIAFTAGYVASNPAIFAVPAEIVSAEVNGKAMERISPQDHVKENEISVLEDKVILNIKDASWTTFTDTNSMDPVLDIGSNGILKTPSTESDVKVGDVITYRSENGLIIHRIVKTGYDNEGWYAIAKGDNNPIEDAGKIRFSQVHGILVAIIY